MIKKCEMVYFFIIFNIILSNSTLIQIVNKNLCRVRSTEVQNKIAKLKFRIIKE